MTKKLPRRSFLSQSFGFAVTAATIPFASFANSFNKLFLSKPLIMNPILNIKPLGFQWETVDPFLFCVHHEDAFPKGNEQMAPDLNYLKGRHLGDDFIIKDGFRMYHGKSVPGFPGHPHRGFETITIVRKGIVDHADSMGASGRYGDGDVQWMTAGKGVQHSEMFPLLNSDSENTMELFQIWLNLPKKNKMVNPHFKMLWKDLIPNYVYTDLNGKNTTVEVIAGQIDTTQAPMPPPDSWASNIDNNVAIWNIKMLAGAVFTLPKASEGVNRTIYFYEGNQIEIAGVQIKKYNAITLVAGVDVVITAGNENVSILLLQGRPINEPVMQYGPFVMNTKQEINEAFDEYNTTHFGGWPWPKYDQVHDRDKSRFAKYSDGSIEEKKG